MLNTLDMHNNMTAANDTTVTLPVGRSVETLAWRVHRFTTSVVVTSLANAGKRGKVCPQWTVYVPGHMPDATLEAVAVFLADAALAGVGVDTMRAFCLDAPLSCPAASVRSEELRGVDVDEPGTVRIDSPSVRGEFTSTGWRLTFSVPLAAGRCAGMMHDYHLDGEKRTARKALAWARENEHRLPSMTRSEAASALRAAGAKVDMR